MLAGCHTLVEKPLATSVQDARALVDTADAHDVTLMAGHTFEYNAAVRKLKEIIASGDLGRVLHIDTARLNLGLYQHDVNVIWDLAPHDLSIISFLMGENPTTVTTWAHHHVGGRHADVAHLRLELAESGTYAFVHVSWLNPQKVRRVTVVGDRKMGLIKYVMSLMNAARLGIGAQSVGLCEAAYREGLKYAHEREQFGKPIIQFAAVSEMLSNMKAKVQGVRALLYETARFVEVYKQYGHISHERSLEAEERQEMKFYNRLADGFTPLVKLFSSEYANQLAYDAIQIHGGSGFMKDYPCERLYRDARIMNIYEGTSQLQVVAAINAVTKGTFLEQIGRYAAESYTEAMCPVVTKLKELTVKFSEMQARVEAGDKEVCGFKDFHARRLVETAGHIIITYLLARQAGEAEEYAASARVFCKLAEAKIAEAYTYVMNSTTEDVALFKAVENEV